MHKAYRTHILVCAGTGCVASGSLKVRDKMISEIERHGLQEEVMVATTGCNGFCAVGPITIVHP
jgi:NADH:ubiquinone oxidoreductase subunit E